MTDLDDYDPSEEEEEYYEDYDEELEEDKDSDNGNEIVDEDSAIKHNSLYNDISEEELSDDEQEFWKDAKKRVSDYALFRRLELTEEDRQIQEETKREAEEMLEAYSNGADDIKISKKDGYYSFSITHDLTKDEHGGITRKSWWKRVFRL